jgi:catechol 2,3-dioxygenase-like lactoylglutathione lyase family enzyme
VRAEDQFHVGIVVDDLEASLEEYAALFGYEWCDEVHVEQNVLLDEGEETIDFQFRYSRSAPRIEVIQGQPGTLWTPAPGSGIHHLGYWSDDVSSDGRSLEQAGWMMEAAGTDERGLRSWAYHRSVHGPRIELVSLALRPLLEPMWAD